MDNTKNKPIGLVETFAQFFQPYSFPSLLIAYSGGLDSHVLLHLAAQLRHTRPTLQVRAIHINHRLQAASDAWAAHCQAQCDALDIPLQVSKVQVKRDSPSLEAQARTARYAAFAQHLQPNEALVTAHHQDDQAETLLLNLLRGAGVAGLAAMPAERAFGGHILVRPLLNVSRAELAAYAQAHELHYINDPSNQDTRFKRNFLRHTIIPQFAEQWPAATPLLARAAQHQAEEQALMTQLLQAPLQQVRGNKPHTLCVSALNQQPVIVQKALLRTWLKDLGFLMPDDKKLQHILSDVLQANPHANPLVTWSGCEIRRYRDEVYALKPLVPAPTQPIMWDGQQPIHWGGYTLKPSLVAPWLGQAQHHNQPFELRPRQGGERIRHGKHTLDLKTIWQTKGVAPWERERIPLIWLNNQLILVPDVELLQ